MAETVIMIHGMMVGGWCWEKYKGFFEEKGYICITPTLRFHDVDPIEPPSPQLGTMSLLDYVKDLQGEIKKLGELPIIMGHSMGGLLAQILGSRGLAKAVVLLTPASPRGILGLRPCVIRTFWSAQTRYGFWRKPFRLTPSEVSYAMLQLLSVEEQERLYGKLVYESGKAACEIGYWPFDLKRASAVDESKITVPVLVIAASQDRATPVSVVKKVAKKYEAVSTYREFAKHSHWVLEEPNWQEVADYTAEWLDKVLGKSG